MHIHLFSTDPELHQTCRDMVRLPAGRDWRLTTYVEPASVQPEGISICDVAGPSDLRLIENSLWARDRIVVADRATLAGNRDRLLTSCPIVLLKPVSSACLEIAIEQTAAEPDNSLDAIRDDREDLLQRLLLANLRFQELDQDRMHFLARSVHEVRAPLTSLSAYCDMLVDRRLGSLSVEQDVVIRRMSHSLSRLSRIVSAMFQLSVGRNGTSAPKLTNGNYVACVEQAIHEIAPMFDQRDIRVSVQLSPQGAPISFDPSQMEQVFVNLLDNCCRYTPRGGRVNISGYDYFWDRRVGFSTAPQSDRRRSAGPVPNAYRIDISDNGPGIALDHLDAIFEEYTAFGDGSDRSGAGLGLAICKMLVNGHRGGIWAESPGVGAIFSLVLPHARGVEHPILLPGDEIPRSLQ